MKFDKSKILTVVTADQAKVGMKGWFAVLPQYFQEIMSGGGEPSVLGNIDLDSPSPFTMKGGHAWPLFYPAPEPTYRPYNNDELNDLVGEILTNKQSGSRKLVTGKPTASQGVNLDGSYITAKDLLASFYRNIDEPCGVREEA